MYNNLDGFSISVVCTLWHPSISNTANSYNISTMSNVGVPGVYRFALNATSLIDPPPPLPTGI